MGHQRERIPEAPHQAKRRSLRIVYFNARSIVNKINELRLYTLDADPDVIAITETWTHSGISNDYLDIANYHIASRHDRKDTVEIKQSKSINQFKNAYDSYWQKKSLSP